jgi:hypothetical protein
MISFPCGSPVICACVSLCRMSEAIFIAAVWKLVSRFIPRWGSRRKTGINHRGRYLNTTPIASWASVGLWNMSTLQRIGEYQWQRGDEGVEVLTRRCGRLQRTHWVRHRGRRSHRRRPLVNENLLRIMHKGEWGKLRFRP